ncbi:MAG: hypothetical protein FJW40_17810 [Acidobacteria bacterium]|nr:hypothetical protein [Acidobacteriota bacterium]
MRTDTALLAVLLSGLACRAADAPSYARDIGPLFATHCSGCHAGSVKMGGLDLDSYEAAMKGGSTGAIVVPGKSAESRLYLMVAGTVKPAMPMDGKVLAAGQIEQIKTWIDAGAKGPSASEAEAIKRRAAMAASPKVAPRRAVKNQIYSLAWSPDGKALALGGFTEVRLVEAATRKTLARLSGHTDAVRAVAFSQDGSLLAAAGGTPGKSGEVKLWDRQGTLLRTLQGHSDCIYALAISPDGKLIATASYDKMVKLWDAATGTGTRNLKDHIDAVYALRFSPDGRLLVSGAADRSVKVWNTSTGERLYTYSDPTDGVNSVAIAPGGRLVAAAGADKSIRVWTLGEKAGAMVNSLISHEDAVLRLAWSPDGKTLASAGADRVLKFLNAADLVELRAIGGQSEWVNGLEFSPDGKWIAVGRHDGSLSLYDTTTYADAYENRRGGN